MIESGVKIIRCLLQSVREEFWADDFGGRPDFWSGGLMRGLISGWPENGVEF